MSAELSTSDARIVVGVDGSPQSRQLVTAWDYPAYEWARWHQTGTWARK